MVINPSLMVMARSRKVEVLGGLLKLHFRMPKLLASFIRLSNCSCVPTQIPKISFINFL